MVVIILKNLVLAGVLYLQLTFSFNKQVELSKRLFHTYMLKEYAFHLMKNSAELMRNIHSEVNAVIVYVIMPIMMLITDILIVSVIIVMLFIFDPMSSALIVTMVGLTSIAILLVFNKKTKRFSKLRQEYVEKMNKYMLQALGGVKEIKIYGNSSFFLSKWLIHFQGNAITNRFITTLKSKSR